ncbi:MAG: hypothetical protein M3010_05610 [Candidatus Dormibacteraeota bacterium]|nr:hypothetical protein [Candidatus Dormibacteraeota bacterium]
MELTRGMARVYNRRSGAHGAGHVGWAFLDEGGLWDTGAVERGGLVTPPGKSGYWSSVMEDPNPRMLTLNYDTYKQFEVHAPSPALARIAVGEVSRRFFNLILHNCMQDTYNVLSAYGANMPQIDKRWDFKPNDWYNLLQGEIRRP